MAREIESSSCDGVCQGRMVPLCSIAKIERSGEIFATFRTSTGWKIDEKILQGLLSGMSVAAEGLRNDFDDMD